MGGSRTVPERRAREAPSASRTPPPREPADIPAEAPPPSGLQGPLRAILNQWRELGGLGRIGMIGLVLVSAVTIVLGVWIERAVAHHFLDARAELLQALVDDLAVAGLVPLGPEQEDPATITEAIERKLIGAGVVGVAVHDVEGLLTYRSSGAPSAAGPPTAIGDPQAERRGDGLLRFHLPVTSETGETLGAFEVYMSGQTFDLATRRIHRSVWFAIITALGVVGLTMGTMIVAHLRVLDDRRRQAERLLQALFRAEEAERERIMGTLHDDVGQNMHGIIYGLQAGRAQLEDDRASAHLAQVERLAREATAVLGRELRNLHEGVYDELDLPSALRDLATNAERHLDLRIHVAVATIIEPAPRARSALLRAAREAIVNVRRHAGTERVWIRARSGDHRVRLEIADDGVGCQAPEGLGLYTARQRLEDVGGGLTVRSRTGGGTVLTAWVPVDTEER